MEILDPLGRRHRLGEASYKNKHGSQEIAAGAQYGGPPGEEPAGEMRAIPSTLDAQSWINKTQRASAARDHAFHHRVAQYSQAQFGATPGTQLLRQIHHVTPNATAFNDSNNQTAKIDSALGLQPSISVYNYDPDHSDLQEARERRLPHESKVLEGRCLEDITRRPDVILNQGPPWILDFVNDHGMPKSAQIPVVNVNAYGKNALLLVGEHDRENYRQRPSRQSYDLNVQRRVQRTNENERLLSSSDFCRLEVEPFSKVLKHLDDSSAKFASLKGKYLMKSSLQLFGRSFTCSNLRDVICSSLEGQTTRASFCARDLSGAHQMSQSVQAQDLNDVINVVLPGVDHDGMDNCKRGQLCLESPPCGLHAHQDSQQRDLRVVQELMQKNLSSHAPPSHNYTETWKSSFQAEISSAQSELKQFSKEELQPFKDSSTFRKSEILSLKDELEASFQRQVSSWTHEVREATLRMERHHEQTLLAMTKWREEFENLSKNHMDFLQQLNRQFLRNWMQQRNC